MIPQVPLPLLIQPSTPFLRKGATRTFKNQLDPPLMTPLGEFIGLHNEVP
jgi:hypothetical protein